MTALPTAEPTAPAHTDPVLPPAARIFTAYHGTQLLVIQHLRRHLRRPPAGEFLIWHPFENNPSVDDFMREILIASDFNATLDIRDFDSLRPRTQSPAAWWFESPRRLRRDIRRLRNWMHANAIDEANAELWADEPIHFNVIFPRGVLKHARQVKIPHCFNHEDSLSPGWKQDLEKNWMSLSWFKKHMFLPWQQWNTGADLRMERVVYDRAYTFALPSRWCADSVDISALISIEAFSSTYRSLPAAVRVQVEAELEPLRVCAKPLVLLLLFGLGEDDAFRTVYQQAIRRIFAERASELRHGTLAVKLHPGGSDGKQEQMLIEWLRSNIPAQVHQIRHRLNLEFMLPQLKPDLVLAGICGGLPMVRDLRASRPIVIAEWLELYLAEVPLQRAAIHQFLRGIEIW
jgi:hypothetical protein